MINIVFYSDLKHSTNIALFSKILLSLSYLRSFYLTNLLVCRKLCVLANLKGFAEKLYLYGREIHVHTIVCGCLSVYMYCKISIALLLCIFYPKPHQTQNFVANIVCVSVLIWMWIPLVFSVYACI